MDELYQSNFGGKPESNLNLIPVKCRFSKVWGKALTLPPAVLSTWRVKQNLLFSAKRATREYNRDHLQGKKYHDK